MPDFKLSAVLTGHTSDVRAVALPDPSFALTASRDGTTRIWKRTSTSPPTYDATESSHAASFKTCLAYAPTVKGYSEGLIFSGGQDTLIEARQPSTTSEENADGIMIGHAHQICSLDVNVEAGYLISGSWDKTARLWEIGQWEPKVELEGHDGSVWAVVAYSKDEVVTGCADRGIRIFDLYGKLQLAFDGQDIVRALTSLPHGHKTGGHLASATNDGVIRVWTLKGHEVAQLIGHESFIYSITVLPTGEIVSCGEDRSVRIWDGPACVQVLTLPTISVWSVGVCPNGDIITGSSDKIARIFTREQERIASGELIAQFDEALRLSAIPQQQMGELNKIDTPGPDFLERKSGTKEGQIQVIKEGDGTMMAYQWSTSQGWMQVGQVVDSVGSSSQKKMYQGKEYDYVIDVDAEEGKPPLKLPYNVTQDPWDAARKFLEDHNLPMQYLEETARFIVSSTQGTTLGPQPQAEISGPDAWGSENRYRPGQTSSSYQMPPPKSALHQTPRLPQAKYVSLVIGKPASSHSQIIKLNSEYAQSGQNDFVLAGAEMNTLSQLFKQLASYDNTGPASLPATPVLAASIPIALKVATQWQPPKNRLAGMDLLRFLAASSENFPDYEQDGTDIVSLVATSGAFDPAILHQTDKLAMCAVRFFANVMFCSDRGRHLIETQYDMVARSVKAASSYAASNVALATAISTYYLNTAVSLTDSGSRTHPDQLDRAVTVISELADYLPSLPSVDKKLVDDALRQATEPVLRGLAALGTVIIGLKSEDAILTAAKEAYDVPILIRSLEAKGYFRDPRFEPMMSELRSALAGK